MSCLYRADEIKTLVEKALQKERSETALIEKAAHALLEKVCALCGKNEKPRVLILCGPGNNGADGLALNALLCARGISSDALLYDNGRRSIENVAFAKDAEILKHTPDFSDYSLIVDALFGVGFHGELPEDARALANAANASGVPVLAVDVPSGINASTGQADPASVRAAYTVCLVGRSLGTAIYPGAQYCGQVTCARLLEETEKPSFDAFAYCTDDIDFTDIAALRRYERAHKGIYGTVAVIAGSKNMAGACYLAARAAYACGAGLVRMITSECNRVILQTLLPEAVLYTYDENTPASGILSALKGCTSVVLGPGVGRSEQARRLVAAVMENSSLPLVLDADGLRLAADSGLIENYKGTLVMTPHFGEASALAEIPTEQISADPLNCIRTLTSRYGHTVLLKDAHTLISDEKRLYVNLSGCDGMATGGSGDVLSGIVGALIGKAETQENVTKCAAYAAYLHGLAGERAQEKYGKHALSASRIAEEIGYVINEKSRRRID